MDPSSSGTAELSADGVERQSFSPDSWLRSAHRTVSSRERTMSVRTNLVSTPFMYAEKTRALASALPAASKTEFGCQSSDSTVVLNGFLICFATHQLLSSSN